MAKKNDPNAVPSAVVTPPVAVPAEAPDTTYRTYRTYPTDVTDATPPSAVVTPPVAVPAEAPDTTYPTDVTGATPPSVEAQVLAKMQAGLTRPQALEVLAQQAAHDQTQKL